MYVSYIIYLLTLFVALHKKGEGGPNSVKTMESTMEVINNPIDLRMMKDNYYGSQNNSLSIIRKLHNEKKMQILLSLQPSNAAVLDLCCGRGGDILKYKKAGVQEVLMIDKDEVSLIEAKKRAAATNLNIFTFKQHDLSKDIYMFRTSKGQQFDIVILHFAIHYFYTDYAALHNIISTVMNSIKMDGFLVISMLSKEKLAKYNYVYKFEENDEVLIDISPVNNILMEDYNQVITHLCATDVLYAVVNFGFYIINKQGTHRTTCQCQTLNGAINRTF